LCDLFQDADSEVRVEAAWVLGFTAPPDTVDRLSLLIKDSDPEIRRHAVWALGLLRARDYRVAVGRLLDDPTAWVRSEAVLTLGRIGGKDDGPRIAALLRDPDRKVRVHAALALGELGALDGGDVLAPLERDPDRLLGLSSTLSLARLGKGTPASLRLALKEIATDDVAFAGLGMAASETASFVQSRETWDLLDRPLPLRRSVESWADLAAALSDLGLTLEVQTDSTIGRLDRSCPLTGRNALAWLLGRFSVPAMVLEGRKILLVDRRTSLSYWLKRLEGR
jgi:HEAT repeat protein